MTASPSASNRSRAVGHGCGDRSHKVMVAPIFLIFMLPMIAIGGQPLPPSMAELSQPIPEQLKFHDAPQTARVLPPFQRIRPEMSMIDVVKLCGMPDEHHGSGIYIFIYRLHDGSVVTVGTGDLKHLIYAKHTDSSGKVKALIPTK